MQAVIYKGPGRPDSYLYVERSDDFSRVPETLLAMFGPLEYVMTLELRPGLKLARVSVDVVMGKLEEQGYYLQLPPPKSYADVNGAWPANRENSTERD